MEMTNTPFPGATCIVKNLKATWMTQEAANKVFDDEVRKLTGAKLELQKDMGQDKKEKSEKTGNGSVVRKDTVKEDIIGGISISFGTNTVAYGKFAVHLGVSQDKIDAYMKMDNPGRIKMTISNILRSKMKHGLDVKKEFDEWVLKNPLN